ncbi:hypothetical protein [Falsiroseomonas sp.]|uniref:hypothetical protein n=1 Tax=Falsiroseomonas sp. TaxID=2870721 RepID=UPI003F70F348
MAGWILSIDRAYVDCGYRGHDADKARVFLSGQKRGVTPAIRRGIRRRAGIKQAIGHLKQHGHLGRNFPAAATGDAINLILAAARHNLRVLLAWADTPSRDPQPPRAHGLDANTAARRALTSRSSRPTTDPRGSIRNSMRWKIVCQK